MKVIILYALGDSRDLDYEELVRWVCKSNDIEFDVSFDKFNLYDEHPVTVLYNDYGESFYESTKKLLTDELEVLIDDCIANQK